MNLLHLQEQKGSGSLFVLSTEWGDIPFKLPSIRRVSQYLSALSLAQDEKTLIFIYETIFRECVVDEIIAFESPDMPAGIVPSVVEYILKISGVSDNSEIYTEELFHTFREQSQAPLNLMIRTICSVFSGYKFSDVRELSYQELVELFMEAEAAMMSVGLVQEPFTFVSNQSNPGYRPDGKIDVDSLVMDSNRIERELNGHPAGSYKRHVADAKQEAVKQVLKRKMTDKRR